MIMPIYLMRMQKWFVRIWWKPKGFFILPSELFGKLLKDIKKADKEAKEKAEKKAEKKLRLQI